MDHAGIQYDLCNSKPCTVCTVASGNRVGMQTAVLVLVIYNQFILIQSFTDGFTSVDAGVLEQQPVWG